jgi:hypothetical protein
MSRIFKPDSGQALEIQDEGGSAALTVETDGDVNLTQNIYLASGKGIYFDGGTTSANYLGGSDAYETGTWTPVIGRLYDPQPSCTYDIRVATYTKIGNMVSVYCAIKISSVTDGGSGYTKLTGLPFAPSSAYPTAGAVASNTAFTEIATRCKPHAVGLTFNTPTRSEANVSSAWVDGLAYIGCVYPV